MSLQYPKLGVVTLLCLLITLLAGCAAAWSSPFTEGGHGESLLDRLQEEAPLGDEAAEHGATSLTIDALLTDVETVAVETGAQGTPFQTLARTGHITQYPCSSCHSEPLADLQSALSTTDPKAHWSIDMAHADRSVMQCTTCHNPENLDTLQTLTGSKVEFDHSYQVCAQCHSGLAEDWAGGAHGKRVAGWAPPRVVNNCTDCHNPHQPAWDIRWPAVTSGGAKEQGTQ